ncbi:hypothetical protein ACYT7O_10680, partial [Streptococcus pyogenes]
LILLMQINKFLALVISFNFKLPLLTILRIGNLYNFIVSNLSVSTEDGDVFELLRSLALELSWLRLLCVVLLSIS